jgi:hypothetical protein
MGVATITPPEQGQLVCVRSRNWIVGDVAPSKIALNGKPAGLERPQHLLTLSSVEDDGLGAELQVIWELEPGAVIIEKVALPEPTGFDAPDRLDTFLDAVRRGASSTADMRNIQAPFRSGIEIEDYQLDPVVRAIQMPRVTLSAVYEVLYAIVDIIREYLHPAGDKEQPRKAFAEACKQFENTFFRKRLYIPPDLFQKVVVLYRNSTAIAEKFTNARIRVEKAAETEEDHHFWSEAIDGLNAEAEPLFAQIVLEFQTRIGVASSKPI